MADLGIIFLRRKHTIHWYQSLFTVITGSMPFRYFWATLYNKLNYVFDINYKLNCDFSIFHIALLLMQMVELSPGTLGVPLSTPGNCCYQEKEGTLGWPATCWHVSTPQRSWWPPGLLSNLMKWLLRRLRVSHIQWKLNIAFVFHTCCYLIKQGNMLGPSWLSISSYPSIITETVQYIFSFIQGQISYLSWTEIFQIMC